MCVLFKMLAYHQVMNIFCYITFEKFIFMFIFRSVIQLGMNFLKNMLSCRSYFLTIYWKHVLIRSFFQPPACHFCHKSYMCGFVSRSSVLVYLPVFTLIPHNLNYCSFIINQYLEASSFLPSSSSRLLWFFAFLYILHFGICLLIDTCWKNNFWDFDWDNIKMD